MINSRLVSDLDTEVGAICTQHIMLCRQEGIELLITSTYRDDEAQLALWKIGREDFPHGPDTRTVTDALPGHSWHNYKCAWDVVPLIMGKCDWVSRDKKTGLLTPVWQKVANLGVVAGAESYAITRDFPEDAHFQVRPKIQGVHIDIKEAMNRFQKSGSIFLAA